MTIDDFEQVHSLWMEIHGFGIRSIDDSKEGVERFIRRNPTTSMVAVCDGKIVGAILCGHDGRRAGLYHVCVQENYRKHGIGQKLVERCLEALKAEKISKVNLIAFKQNEIGNRFWQSLGWKYCSNSDYEDCEELTKVSKTRSRYVSFATVLACQPQQMLCLPSKNRRLPSVFSTFCQFFTI